PVGAAYVFRYDGSIWLQEQILSVGIPGDEFGYSVGIRGDTIVVGARSRQSSHGAVYVFGYNGSSWVQEQLLTASDGALGDRFGHVVSMDGPMLAVGAPYDQEFGPETGACYLYRFDGAHFTDEIKLVTPAGYSYARYGWSVSVDGGFLVVGAPIAGGPDGSGWAFTYRGTAGGIWTLQNEFPGEAAFEAFGTSVAVNNGGFLVGAPYGTISVPSSGVARNRGRPAVASFAGASFSGAFLPWCFFDQSENGSYAFGGTATVTGGDDGVSTGTMTRIEQGFDLQTESHYRVSFSWSYTCVDDPGFDGAYWDLIDVETGISKIGGPLLLADTSGEFGVESVSFTGGSCSLRFAVYSGDNIGGPGVAVFDDLSIVGDEPYAPLTHGDFADESGVPWVFTDTSRLGLFQVVDGTGVVVGSRDYYTTGAETFIAQRVAVGGGPRFISFGWSYECLDAPGYDAIEWDIVDQATGLSAIGGREVLSDIGGAAGHVARAFSGSGNYELRLGVTSVDSIYGPGIATFDTVSISPDGVHFTRGDANADGSFDISDAVKVLDYLFVPGSTAPTCLDAADCNDDGGVDISDAVYVLSTLFTSGPPIPAPHPFCGPDPTTDALGCASFPPCP
ncbi:MAG: hypothetical protein KDC38_00665, partial [Planctomycetes bacterium]|nr:hypothetical protein [Planctomycetota bacterium]